MPTPIVWIDSDGIEHPMDELLPRDGVSGANIGIDFPHHEIHEGDNYVVQEGIQLNNGSKEYLITTPDTTKLAHMVIAIEGGQDTVGTVG